MNLHTEYIQGLTETSHLQKHEKSYLYQKSGTKIDKIIPASNHSHNRFCILGNEDNGHFLEIINLPKLPPVYLQEHNSSALVNILTQQTWCINFDVILKKKEKKRNKISIAKLTISKSAKNLIWQEKITIHSSSKATKDWLILALNPN